MRPLVAIALFVFIRPAFADSFDSVYTDLSSGACKAMKERDDVEYEAARCPGVGGYALITEYSDQRQSVTVVAPDGKEHSLNLWDMMMPGFSHLGTKAEWRIVPAKGKVVPKALIVRVYTAANKSSYLAVAKIAPRMICVTDAIKESAHANEAARRLADRAEGQSCLEY